jgi:nitrate reductase NapD
MSECPSSLESLPVVSSLVVQAKTAALTKVQDLVVAHPHADVYGSDEISKMVVVIEAENDKKLADFMQSLSDVEGVLTVNMVFHHNDDFSDDIEGINANGLKVGQAKVSSQ